LTAADHSTANSPRDTTAHLPSPNHPRYISTLTSLLKTSTTLLRVWAPGHLVSLALAPSSSTYLLRAHATSADARPSVPWFYLSEVRTRPSTTSRESYFFKGAAGPCSQLRKLLLHVLSRRLVASVGIVGDVMGRWCRRRPPRVVVGAEEDRGELFGGGRGCGSEMGCRQSLSGFNLGKAPGSAW